MKIKKKRFYKRKFERLYLKRKLNKLLAKNYFHLSFTVFLVKIFNNKVV